MNGYKEHIYKQAMEKIALSENTKNKLALGAIGLGSAWVLYDNYKQKKREKAFRKEQEIRKRKERQEIQSYISSPQAKKDLDRFKVLDRTRCRYDFDNDNDYNEWDDLEAQLSHAGLISKGNGFEYNLHYNKLGGVK